VQVTVLRPTMVGADSVGGVHVFGPLPCVWSGSVRIRCMFGVDLFGFVIGRQGARVSFFKKYSSNGHVDCYDVLHSNNGQPTRCYRNITIATHLKQELFARCYKPFQLLTTVYCSSVFRII
jgi:hypothetical protein